MLGSKDSLNPKVRLKIYGPSDFTNSQYFIVFDLSPTVDKVNNALRCTFEPIMPKRRSATYNLPACLLLTLKLPI